MGTGYRRGRLKGQFGLRRCALVQHVFGGRAVGQEGKLIGNPGFVGGVAGVLRGAGHGIAGQRALPGSTDVDIVVAAAILAFGDLVDRQGKVAVLFAGYPAEHEEPAIGVDGPDREVHAAVGVDDLYDFADTNVRKVFRICDEGLAFAAQSEGRVRISALGGGRDEQETGQQEYGFHWFIGV